MRVADGITDDQQTTINRQRTDDPKIESATRAEGERANGRRKCNGSRTNGRLKKSERAGLTVKRESGQVTCDQKVHGRRTDAEHQATNFLRKMRKSKKRRSLKQDGGASVVSRLWAGAGFGSKTKSSVLTATSPVLTQRLTGSDKLARLYTRDFLPK